MSVVSGEALLLGAREEVTLPVVEGVEVGESLSMPEAEAKSAVAEVVPRSELDGAEESEDEDVTETSLLADCESCEELESAAEREEAPLELGLSEAQDAEGDCDEAGERLGSELVGGGEEEGGGATVTEGCEVCETEGEEEEREGRLILGRADAEVEAVEDCEWDVAPEAEGVRDSAGEAVIEVLGKTNDSAGD